MSINKNNIRSKFSLIELISAMSIVVILSGITIGVYSFIFTKTKNDKTRAVIIKTEMAMRSYKHDVGYFIQQPTLGSLTINTSNREFLKHIDYTRMKNGTEINANDELIDAWGNPIMYQCPGAHNRTMFDLISYGKDGANNSGIGDDITNFTNY